MRRRMPVVAVVAAAAFVGIVPASASATPFSSALFGFNGGTTFNDTLDCAENGAGDTWRARWFDQPAADGTGVLAGSWNGDFEVHRGLAPGSAFIPGNDGRIAVEVSSAGGRKGVAFFDTVGGTTGCNNAPLTLTPLDANNPNAQQVSGTMPIVATGGLGALRGLTGTGSADFALNLTPGADNDAILTMSGDLDVLDPQVSVASGFGRWDNLTAWLNKRLRVWVTLVNPASAGDAFNVTITGAGGGPGFQGLPAGNVPIPHGGGAQIGFVMTGANPGQKYTIGVQATLNDGLLAPQPPIIGHVTFTAPLLP